MKQSIKVKAGTRLDVEASFEARQGQPVFVAEIKGVVVGFASWQDDELLALFVHPDQQVKGVGIALLPPAQKRPPLKDRSSSS